MYSLCLRICVKDFSDIQSQLSHYIGSEQIHATMVSALRIQNALKFAECLLPQVHRESEAMRMLRAVSRSAVLAI